MANQAIFDERPTRRTSVAESLLLGGSRRRAVAQVHPTAPKMSRALSAFP